MQKNTVPEEDVVSLYTDFYSVKHISEITGISSARVLKTLKERNIRIRGRSEARRSSRKKDRWYKPPRLNANEKFWRHVSISGLETCWEWTGAKTDVGYGFFTHEKKNGGAHRWAWFLTRGSYPNPSEVICHSCDNKSCVNPCHLFIGSHMDNSSDMVRKKRHLKNQMGSKSKTSLDDAVKVKHLLSLGYSPTSISRCFGININSCWGILYGTSCKHVVVPDGYSLSISDKEASVLEKKRRMRSWR